MKAIYLVGFMGSGKSTFGKQLADGLGISFFDLDQVIENRTGKSIPQLFQEWGEIRFREYEAEVLRSFAKEEDDFVLACGGGTPCFHDSLAWMKSHGYTLFIDTPFADIEERLKGSEAIRPVLMALRQTKNEDSMYQLYIQRREIYLQAASILGPERLNVNEVIHMLNS